MLVDYSFRQVEYFVQAAALGTISAAAESCNISQTAVSLGIAGFERHLGVQLFVRRKAKGVVLTEAGARVLPAAREMLSLARQLRIDARAEGDEIAGRLTFGSTSTLAPVVVPQLLDDLVRRHPGLDLAVMEGQAETLRQSLLNGECDIALMYADQDMTGLDWQSVSVLKPYVLLPEGHRLAGRAAVLLADLADEPLITPFTSPGTYDSEAVLRSVGITPRVGLRSGSMEVIRAAVARGLGYAILVQRWLAKESSEGRPLIAREIADPVPPTRVVLARAAGVRRTARSQAVAGYCAAAFGPDAAAADGAGDGPSAR